MKVCNSPRTSGGQFSRPPISVCFQFLHVGSSCKLANAARELSHVASRQLEMNRSLDSCFSDFRNTANAHSLLKAGSVNLSKRVHLRIYGNVYTFGGSRYLTTGLKPPYKLV